MSELQNELGNIDAAQLGYEKVLLQSPLEKLSIKSLARIYLQKGRIEDAIALFERLVRADQLSPLADDPDPNNDEEMSGFLPEDDEYRETEEILADPSMGTKKQRMEYEEINMLSELYMELEQYAKAVETIHNGLCGLFDLAPDSISWKDAAQYNSTFPACPSELRGKIGICCLFLGETEAAEGHIAKLFVQGAEYYPEAYFEVGEAYLKLNRSEYALRVFNTIAASGGGSGLVKRKIALCYANLGDYQHALKTCESSNALWLTVVLRREPNDVEIQNQIVILLEKLGDDRRAAQMQRKFLLRREQETLSAQSLQGSVQSTPGEMSPKSQPLFKVKASSGTSKAVDKAARQRRIEEETKTAAENSQLYLHLCAISDRLDKKQGRIEYCHYGAKLVDALSAVEKHFTKPRRKKDELEGMGGNRGAMKRIGFGMMESGFELPIAGHLQDPKFDAEIQGLTLRQWFQVFADFSHAAAVEGRWTDATNSLNTAFAFIPFRADPRLSLEIQLLMVAVAFRAKEYETVSSIVRSFCLDGDYVVTGFRLLSLLLTGEPRAVAAYTWTSNQKFFYRQILKVQAAIDKDPTSISPLAIAHLLASNGHVLLFSKNYSAAISHYLKARKMIPKDPMANLCLAVSYLHRATNKNQSRPLHIIRVRGCTYSRQAFSFLLCYYELSGQSAEAEYNVARAFHFLSKRAVCSPKI
ncbi:transcription factor TFIIIC subunit tfc4 [Kappamyces sp. JEL0680]|nr:transcription factor TFIIIC subunit tfc4 [Kappamyces sp. JEL0680]